MKAPLLEPHEIQMVKDWVLLPVLVDVIQRDIRRLRHADMRFMPLFTQMLEEAQACVMHDVSTLKRELHMHGIRVYEQHRTKQCLKVKYKCRGYEHQLHLLWEIVRVEVLKKMSEYLNINFMDGRGSS